MTEPLRLSGVDHTARPTWKLRETVEFYRDILGLPLVHAVTARGWGPPGHHDFLHFFFDSGEGSSIAFFYYIGSKPEERDLPRSHHFSNATHTAWRVNNEAELQAWTRQLTERGVMVSPFTRHEVIESIYFHDPNGYPVEITRRLREIAQVDLQDAALTLEAAIAVESEGDLLTIDDVWRRKGELLAQKLGLSIA
jgi:catechol 2,3-dioxygenase-like lactoylglutathione lyase family enzyme